MPNGKPKMAVFNVKIPVQVLEALRRQAKKEDRTAAYLVRVFVKAGLDERQRMVSK
jgi:hypothetical protein